jgi:hypothetical protein
MAKIEMSYFGLFLTGRRYTVSTAFVAAMQH